MRRVLYIVSLLCQTTLVPVCAQQLEPLFVRWEVSPPAGEAWSGNQRDTSVVRRRDYRYEGLAVGAVSLGALGAYIGSQLSLACPTVPGARCNTDRLGNAVALGLTAAAVGGGLGYLIGRLSSKPHSDQGPVSLRAPVITDSTRRRLGYQHWKGAAIGSVSGALLGTLLVLWASGSCSDCNRTQSDLLGVGLTGVGLGGALGFLVGLATPKYESQPATSE